jgi:hypothetical protein
MIGSRCIACDVEVQEFEKFYIVEEGIVHSKCRESWAEGKAVASTTARVVSKEQEHGRR